jgi:hypothetical protein
MGDAEPNGLDAPRREDDTMKRAILLLATALVGVAGCTSRPCNSEFDLNVFWPRFTDAAGNTFACTDARSGVAGIQVFIDGNPQLLDNLNRPAPVACVPFPGRPQGITLLAFAPGTYQVEVQAYDANGNLLYDDQAAVPIRATCGGTDFNANMVAVAADMTVAVNLPGGACATPTSQSAFSSTFLWYELRDQSGNVFATSSPTVDSQQIPCTSSHAILFSAAPFGRYTLTRIQEVELEFGGTFVVRSFNCAATSFQHAQLNDGVTVPLTGGNVNCF